MHFRTLFFAILMLLSSVYAAAESRDLAGHYYLQGSMEMGSQLLLQEDGTFVGEIIYGSAGGVAKGTWQVEGDTLSLKKDAVPTAQTAEKLTFDMGYETDLAEVEAVLQRKNDPQFELARKNHVLHMHYSRRPEPPAIKPVDVYLEFSQGPSAQLLWRNTDQWRLSLPFDERRVLEKIGFRMASDSGPIQWFKVSPTGRWLEVGWKRTSGRQLSFDPPKEVDLDETQHYFRHDPEELEHIQQNYLITLFYSEVITPPEIKPVDIYWHFQDGSIQQQVWADSKQTKLLLPHDSKRTLQKVGLRLQGSTEPIWWIAVTPTARWFSINWKEHSSAQDDDLSVLFKDMTLEIQPNCLAVDLGNGNACYRK